MSNTTEDELSSQIETLLVDFVIGKTPLNRTRSKIMGRVTRYTEAHYAQKHLQAKKDLLAEVRELQRYKWMCETLHGGYNADEKDVHAALKRYSEREDLRADFAAFFESAAIKEIEEGL